MAQLFSLGSSPHVMPKVKERLDEDAKRWSRLMGDISDPVLMILKAHLLIEEQLYAIVRVVAPAPDYLEQARLSFRQVSRVARAFSQPLSQPGLWDAIDRVNAIRNRLAHRIEPEGVDELLDELCRYCDASPTFKRCHGIVAKGSKLYMIFMIIFGSLSGLSGVVEITNKRVSLAHFKDAKHES